MNGGTLLDVLLVVLLVAYTAGGVRRGFVYGSLSLFGFVAGGVVGLLLLPHLVSLLEDGGRLPALLRPGLGRLALVVLVVLVLAWAGQLVGSLLGRQLRDRVTWRPARVLDKVLGAVAALAAVALLTWFVAGALRALPSPAVSRAVTNSRVVQAVDAVVPSGVDRLAHALQRLMQSQGFPKVFDGISPEVILPVDPPRADEVTGAAAVAADSTVKITGLAADCDRRQEGSGFVVAPERVVTNAHVVAGVDTPYVRVGGDGPKLRGQVVLLDVDLDLAVVAVPGLDAQPLPLGTDQHRGAPVVVAGYPLDGPYTAEPARVRQVLTASGEDIYGQPGVDRRVYSLYADVEPGNSGGPLLDPEGRLVGVVFAKSLDDAQTGYALTLAQSLPVLQQAPRLTRAVDSGRCPVG
ncbi:MAG: MarP family serine protease [Actinomycetes bacterium]